MNDKVYVVIAKMGGDEDIAFFIFDNKDYFNSFVDFAENMNDGSDEAYDEIISQIEHLKATKELFPNVDMDELEENIGDYDLRDFFPPESIQETWDIKEFHALIKEKKVSREARIEIF